MENMNHSCFSGLWQNGSIPFNQPSLTIPAGVLLPNSLYHFSVELINRENASVRATGYLSVQIQDAEAYPIAIE